VCNVGGIGADFFLKPGSASRFAESQWTRTVFRQWSKRGQSYPWFHGRRIGANDGSRCFQLLRVEGRSRAERRRRCWLCLSPCNGQKASNRATAAGLLFQDATSGTIQRSS